MKKTKELQTTKEILNLLIINKSMRTPEMFEAFLESNPTAEDFVKLYAKLNSSNIEELEKMCKNFPELRKYLSLATINTCAGEKIFIESGDIYYDENGKIKLVDNLCFRQSIHQSMLKEKIKAKFEATINGGEIEFYCICNEKDNKK
jgi:hypothetical protein